MMDGYFSNCPCQCHRFTISDSCIPSPCLCDCNNHSQNPYFFSSKLNKELKEKVNNLSEDIRRCEDYISHLYDSIEKLFSRIERIESHINFQVDENRKISRRVDDIAYQKLLSENYES